MKLIEFHDERPSTEKAVRRVAVKLGDRAFPDIFAVKRADTLAQSEFLRQTKLDNIDYFEKTYKEIKAAGDALAIKDLNISGKDLLDMGVPQGKAVGEILQTLFEEVIDNPSVNDRDYLINRAKELKNNMA